MKAISNHEPQERHNERSPLSPSFTKWELEIDGRDEWRLYPPGNEPHFHIGLYNRHEAARIGELIAHSFELGKRSVQDAITAALGVRKAGSW